ncbi:MAG: acetyl-CoA carboxylase biotin carboxylase subunit [Deltaproteobacteria bacterium]|nr:acetyl-CoA carboxylase biotin carboxylase subunit [Deltaproteobacteria bacterium]
MAEPKQKVTKVLIANRGEIAVRVMRTCREMGIPTVAVYSDPDRTSLHVRYATEAYHIGPAAPAESYLNMDKLFDVIKRSGADAVHPGYGFLSENPDFARRCTEEGVTFIGPPPESMDAMASKTMARQCMIKAGVPVIPGLEDCIEDEAEALKYSIEIGFPVMLKATAGGGGKGMRKVDCAEDFESAWRATRSEAKNSFVDDSVYIEKFLEKPRHIEIQVFADSHGNVHHLFDRECSVQRRHQKVIEEAPSPFVSDEMREAMGAVAIKAARAVNYLGAGTVEFLVDAKRNFYFMEMNTRLQVEHPVTEMITGFDLVEAQICVARGEKLPWGPQPDKPRGHAVEARVCAENPAMNFVPTPGPIEHQRTPGGQYVRTDTAVYPGFEVTADYDPMIAKVIAWGKTREIAIVRLERALGEYTLKGCTTNVQFCRQVLANREFASGEYDTGIIPRMMDNPDPWSSEEHETVALLSAAFSLFEEEQRRHTNVATGKGTGDPSARSSAWKRSLPGRTPQKW